MIIALFISFFPIISSGPIQRADKLIPQLKKSHSFDYYDATNGIKIFAWGFVKKFFLANRISLYVNYVYGNIDKQYGLALFFATILYSFQIYFDFSGYSDMAIGIARYMGFDIGKNFDHPYLSQSVGEFWRRWHISLSTWLRDYVYIPLGGSRVALPRIYANIFITFFISGIWHGSTWNFVIWGLLHGFYQCIERILKPVIEKLKIPTWIKIVITFLLISFAWIFFRTETLSQAVIIIQKIVQIPQNIVQLFSHKNQNDFTETIRMMFSLYHNACKGFKGMLISLFSLFIFSCISYFTREKSELCIFNKLPTVLRWIIYYIVFAFIIMQFFNLLSQSTNTEFIYFNF